MKNTSILAIAFTMSACGDKVDYAALAAEQAIKNQDDSSLINLQERTQSLKNISAVIETLETSYSPSNAPSSMEMWIPANVTPTAKQLQNHKLAESFEHAPELDLVFKGKVINPEFNFSGKVDNRCSAHLTRMKNNRNLAQEYTNAVAEVDVDLIESERLMREYGEDSSVVY